ncbi:MAG: hypothetical protein WEB89_03240 [Balneolales bacterium]
MDSISRAFAYTSTTLMLGVIIYMFTQNIAHYVNQPGVTGIVFSLGFLLFYLNVSYLLSKRFARKTILLENFPYVMAFLLTLPVVILSTVTGQFFMVIHQVFFVLITLMGSLLGASLGIKKGLKLRKEFFNKSENEPEIPEDLRHAREKLSNN